MNELGVPPAGVGQTRSLHGSVFQLDRTLFVAENQIDAGSHPVKLLRQPPLVEPPGGRPELYA